MASNTKPIPSGIVMLSSAFEPNFDTLHIG
jgi:hypothetical protein